MRILFGHYVVWTQKRASVTNLEKKLCVYSFSVSTKSDDCMCGMVKIEKHCSTIFQITSNIILSRVIQFSWVAHIPCQSALRQLWVTSRVQERAWMAFQLRLMLWQIAVWSANRETALKGLLSDRGETKQLAHGHSVVVRCHKSDIYQAISIKINKSTKCTPPFIKAIIVLKSRSLSPGFVVWR